MRALVCPTAFKESLSGHEVAQIIASQAPPGTYCIVMPLSDGGDGFLDSLQSALHAHRETIETVDAVGRPLLAPLLRQPTGGVVIESAKVIGLAMTPPNLRGIGRASSFGLGDLIVKAGPTEAIVGLGGTATNDGGLGMLLGLGARAMDAQGNLLSAQGDSILRVAALEPPPPLEIELTIACDVTIPLAGPSGASALFAAQKGATPQQVAAFAEAHQRWGEILERTFGRAVSHLPGAGAAGGLGAAFASLGARMQQGIDAVMNLTGFDAALQNADIVITGEGSIDAQTGLGKVVGEVARRAHSLGRSVHLVCGRFDEAARAQLSPITSVRQVRSVDNARQRLLEEAADLFRSV